jgi:outer membrane protein
MRNLLFALATLLPAACFAQTNSVQLPTAPRPATLVLSANRAEVGLLFQAMPNTEMTKGDANHSSLVAQNVLATPISLAEAEHRAMQNNPRIAAGRLLALASGQVTRQTRSAELPQISGAITAEKAEDGGRIGAGALTDSRLYTHAGTGGSFSQLITDFGHTGNLVASDRLRQKAQDQAALATQQDVLLATDQAFYRLLNAQSLLSVARATVQARQEVQTLSAALVKNQLKSDLDLSIASADLSQAQLLQLDAETSVQSASAALAALLAAPPDTVFLAIEDADAALPPPPSQQSSAAANASAQAQRPDLQSLRLDAEADRKFARAQELKYLPTLSAVAIGGITPVRPDGVFVPDWYAAGGVNLSLPIFSGFRIAAQAAEARLRQQAADKQAQELSDSIARDVRIAMLTAITAFQRVRVADQFRTQTAQALVFAQTRYKLGLSSIVELSQAQLQSTQAAVSAVNARYDYLLALRSLDYVRGQLAP